MERTKQLEAELLKTPEKQISLTDPDARSLRTRGTGIVGYNVQTAAATKYHLIVAHEVTNEYSNRGLLFSPWGSKHRQRWMLNNWKSSLTEVTSRVLRFWRVLRRASQPLLQDRRPQIIRSEAFSNEKIFTHSELSGSSIGSAKTN